MKLVVHPVTPGHAEDRARFWEAHGKFRNCSCMRWRLTSSKYKGNDQDRPDCRYMRSVRSSSLSLSLSLSLFTAGSEGMGLSVGWQQQSIAAG